MSQEANLFNGVNANVSTGRLVTTGVGGAVFGCRLYTAVQLLSVKSSWLAPITGWLKGTGPIY